MFFEVVRGAGTMYNRRACLVEWIEMVLGRVLGSVGAWCFEAVVTFWFEAGRVASCLVVIWRSAITTLPRTFEKTCPLFFQDDLDQNSITLVTLVTDILHATKPNNI